MRKSFLIHIDSLDILDELTNNQCGELFRAIKSHHAGEEIELSPLVKVAFSPFRNQFKRDLEKYQKTCEARAIAGSMGGKQKVANASKSKQRKPIDSKPKQVVAKLADSESKNDNKSDSESITKPLSSKPDQVLEIFQYWCEIMKKQMSTTKLTPKRMKAIKARLKDYEPHVIKTAILSCSKDPFSMGQNDRQKPFNDIELICRNGEKLESFLPQATLDVHKEKSWKKLAEEMVEDGDVPNQD